MKLCLLFALFLGLCPLCMAELNVTREMAKLDSAGLNITCGQDDKAGTFILCRESAVIENGNVMLAQETAKLQAKTAIAEFINVNIKATARSSEQTDITIKDDKESFASREFTQKCLTKNVSQILRGITVCSMKQIDSQVVIYCLLVENVLDASANLQKAAQKMGPDTVQVVGSAFISKDITEAQAEKYAIAEAQREAIANVMGISIVSSAERKTNSEVTIKDENESFDCDESFKAQVFSAAAGFVESYRILDKKIVDNAVFVTIVAKVAKNKVMDDYRAYLEGMGNPGFCVRSNSAALLTTFSDFFAGLGLRMVDNPYDAAYLIDVRLTAKTSNLHVSVTVKDKVANTVLFSQDNTSENFPLTGNKDEQSICMNVLNSMKNKLHGKLNTFIARANADGRQIIIRLTNFDSEFQTSANIIKKILKGAPGTTNVNMNIRGDTVEYNLNYKGNTEDLAAILEKHIQTDIKRRALRPVRDMVKNTLVVFNFE